MKCLGAGWIEQAMEYLADNPQIIVDGFRHAGIYAALGLLDKDDDDFPDCDDSNPESEFDSCDEDQLSQGEGTYDFDLIAEDELSDEHHMVKKVPLTVDEIFTSTDDEYGD